MTEKEKNALRERILDRSVEVEVRIEQLRDATQPISPDKGLGRLTRLEAMQDKGVNEAALQRLRDGIGSSPQCLGQHFAAGFRYVRQLWEGNCH